MNMCKLVIHAICISIEVIFKKNRVYNKVTDWLYTCRSYVDAPSFKLLGIYFASNFETCVERRFHTHIQCKAWSKVLHEYVVDDSAQHEIFALAQSGPRGRVLAFSLMTKLFSKKINDNNPRNPSAFVHSAVINAWGSLHWGDVIG